ncbi:MAG: hypothetical protein FJX52_11500 [Alphaproteobacteria bacterium]|nr:hypothetical protein [Alphaproteobacteria bacterium]
MAIIATIQDILALAQRQQQAGRGDQAEALYRRILEFDRAQPDARFGLGAVLLALGRHRDTVDQLRAALAVVPHQPGPYLYLATALLNLDALEDALAAVQAAQAVAPDLGAVTGIRDTVLDAMHVHAERDFSAHRISRAIARMGQVAHHRPTHAQVQARLGCYLTQAGRVGEGVDRLRHAAALAPDDRGTLRDLILSLNLLENADPSDQLAQRRLFDRRFMAPLAPANPGHANPRQPDRRLRLGYVTGEFIRAHTACDMLIPLFAGHDSDTVELHVYTDVPQERADAVTQRVRAMIPGWHPTEGLSDAAVADQVRADGIDVLIDAIGFSDTCRLGVFAHRPAPLQVSMTLMGGSGMAAVPYVITDRWMSPDDRAGDYSETFIHVPSLYLYRPMLDLPAPAPPPALARGHVTFGCFNQLAKISPGTVAVWARVLTAVPGSRLLLKALALDDADICRGYLDQFAAHGIAPDRVVLRAWAGDFLQHIAAYDDIDIGLDPLPYGGGTTTREALWMGVPVVTLPGPTAVQRYGISILRVIGLEQGIAIDADDYVARAAAWARDLAGLANLRAALRARIEGSPLCDGRLFAGTLEAALRDLWRQFCAAAT